MRNEASFSAEHRTEIWMTKRSSRVDFACRALRQAIIEQALPPGTKLPEDELGARFGVSRTHVRLVLEDAERNGDLVLSGRGGRRVELKPSVLRAFDNFLADAMSGHDLLYRLTLDRMAAA